jgi:hypothetical protein
MSEIQESVQMAADTQHELRQRNDWTNLKDNKHRSLEEGHAWCCCQASACQSAAATTPRVAGDRWLNGVSQT